MLRKTLLVLLLFFSKFELVRVILKRIFKENNFGYFVSLKENILLSEKRGIILQKTKMMKKWRKRRSKKYKRKRESRKEKTQICYRKCEIERVFGKCQSKWHRFIPHF